jgi:antitoxin ParD1/3/4
MREGKTARKKASFPDSQKRAFFVIVRGKRRSAMNVSIGQRWEGFVEKVVQEGRYGSASEVVREGLRLVEEREAKLLALRATIESAIALDGEVSDAELDEALEQQASALARKGLGA